MPRTRVRLPHRDVPPLRLLGRRLLWAVGLLAFIACVAYLGRDGYVDAKGDDVTLLDTIYYASVSATGTGYGDIRPESDHARLVHTIFVTPAQVLFLLLLVGTTVELLAGRSADSIRVSLWRRRLKDHVIVCGYGSTGRSAVKTLRGKGVGREEIIVIDTRQQACEAAEDDGYATIRGSASDVAVLHDAGVSDAGSIVVAPDRDDTAVLITLTAREHNQGATIVAACRDDENVHLLHQSGATSVITSSSASGRLLGLATVEPRVVEVLEDIMTIGHGIDIGEREIGQDEVGRFEQLPIHEPVIAIVRDGELLRFDDPQAAHLKAGDRLVYLAAVGRGQDTPVPPSPQ